MLMDSNKLFTYGRKYFGNTREIFMVTVMGEELYIATSAQDVSSIYKSSKAFDFNAIINDIFEGFGITASTMQKMYELNWGQRKHWIDIIHEIFKEQMHHGEKLVELQTTFLRKIDDCLSWYRLSGAMLLSEPSDNIKVVSIYKWTYEVLVSAASTSFFGNAILDVNPDLLKDFLIFDTEAWKMLLKYPPFAAKDMFEAKAKCEAAFERYLALPVEKREDATWLVRNIETAMKGLGIPDDQTAVMHFILLRLINTNAYRACFWSLSHLLQDQALQDSIMRETKPAFSSDGKLSMTYLLDHCPLLNSFYEEVVRETTYPIGARMIVNEITIGNTVLHPGKKVLMPFQQMHSNPDVFGKNAAEFDPTRFLNNPSLSKSTSYRPFGTGLTYCPGIFLARREISCFWYRFCIALISR
ncbi:cytochrome P450 protein [Rutstroemia sp. NJR-2017a BBW]|nr:cytochrome P450 protein [Rutstroemia sp. NJR-2017a BBW]